MDYMKSIPDLAPSVKTKKRKPICQMKSEPRKTLKDINDLNKIKEFAED